MPSQAATSALNGRRRIAARCTAAADTVQRPTVRTAQRSDQTSAFSTAEPTKAAGAPHLAVSGEPSIRRSTVARLTAGAAVVWSRAALRRHLARMIVASGTVAADAALSRNARTLLATDSITVEHTVAAHAALSRVAGWVRSGRRSIVAERTVAAVAVLSRTARRVRRARLATATDTIPRLRLCPKDRLSMRGDWRRCGVAGRCGGCAWIVTRRVSLSGRVRCGRLTMRVISSLWIRRPAT